MGNLSELMYFVLGWILPRHSLRDTDRRHRAASRHEDKGAGGAQRLLDRPPQDGDVRLHRADDDDESQHAGRSQ